LEKTSLGKENVLLFLGSFKTPDEALFACVQSAELASQSLTFSTDFFTYKTAP
jgi:hypothetical protein